ncbi:MAG: histidine kinase [Rhodococcus sp. (in: high G+C Gram-positive bacteria)]
MDDERRRIERDLHDGVQQQLGAVGMLIARARRAEGPEKLHELLTQDRDHPRGDDRLAEPSIWRDL